ncbi:MAG: LLM class flavin-dependent oxidoreductase, partial [Candidatus Dormibacteraceae bacterium]
MKVGLGARARSSAALTAFGDAAAEEGFEHFWAYDSGRCVEAVVALSYVAFAHPGLVVGTATTNTETRDPAVLANALATLSNLTGGRVMCGIGLGDSAVRFIGRRPTRIADFADRLRAIRALLGGETINYNGRRYRLPDPPQKPPLLLISAEGPKTCTLAATAADGAILSLGASPGTLAYL